MTRQGKYVRKFKAAPRVHRDIAAPDWSGLINALVRAGYPKMQIALAADTSKAWIYAMLRGATPPWDVGQAVLRLVEVVGGAGGEDGGGGDNAEVRGD